jgi:hypothetical protein
MLKADYVLIALGTIEELARHKVWLKDGENLILYSEDLEADGVVEYSTEENIWVAVINWDNIRYSILI